MTPQQIVGLAIRLLAIWLVISSIQYFIAIPAALHGADIDDKSTQSYIVAGAYISAAMLLWLFPMWIAHKLIPRTRFENTISVQPLEAARVGCALTGLWLSAHGFLDMVWYAFRAFLIAGSQSAFASLGTGAKLDFIATLANLALGLLLIFRAGTFATLVIRYPVPQGNESNPSKPNSRTCHHN